jgi:mannosyltransferase OCH1-like enzyme
MKENNIPKVIHNVWFGHNKKSDLILKCLNSWKNILNDYELTEWTEDNFDINKYPFVKKMCLEKKWAFASDYARLVILYKNGGIYLDTDMYVLKSFDDFLNHDLVLGKEDGMHISAGMIACTPNNVFIKKCLEYYDNNQSEIETIPRILTKVFEEYKLELEKNKQNNYLRERIKLFEPVYFYPFDANQIKKFNYKNAPDISYAAHLWNYSWGHPLVKLIKRMGMHKILINILNILKIKSFLKKKLKIA